MGRIVEPNSGPRTPCPGPQIPAFPACECTARGAIRAPIIRQAATSPEARTDYRHTGSSQQAAPEYHHKSRLVSRCGNWNGISQRLGAERPSRPARRGRPRPRRRARIARAADRRRARGVAGRPPRRASRSAERAEVALLCVPDDAIAEACVRAIAGAVPPLRLVGHDERRDAARRARCRARRRGARRFSLHPLQTVPDGGDEPRRRRLRGRRLRPRGARDSPRALARALGMRPFEVPTSAAPPTTPPPRSPRTSSSRSRSPPPSCSSATGVEDARELLAPARPAHAPPTGPSAAARP